MDSSSFSSAFSPDTDILASSPALAWACRAGAAPPAGASLPRSLSPAPRGEDDADRGQEEEDDEEEEEEGAGGGGEAAAAAAPGGAPFFGAPAALAAEGHEQRPPPATHD